MSLESGEGYKPPGAEEWKAPETGGKSTEVEDGLKAIKEQVETTNQKYQEYDAKHPDLNLSAKSFSVRTLGLMRHAAENVEDGGDRSKEMGIAYSKAVDTLTKMTPEQQQSVDYDRRFNQATANFREQELAVFRKIDTDKLLAAFLIDRARENGVPTTEITNAESIAREEGVMTDRADRVLDELGKFRSLDKNFITPKSKSV